MMYNYLVYANDFVMTRLNIILMTMFKSPKAYWQAMLRNDLQHRQSNRVFLVIFFYGFVTDVNQARLFAQSSTIRLVTVAHILNRGVHQR